MSARIDCPVIQAPIGGAAGPNACCGCIGAGGLAPWLSQVGVGPARAPGIREVRQKTDRPFACNLLLSYDVPILFEAMYAERVPIVSLFWGDPAPLAARIRDAGALLICTIGSVVEAERAAEAGADVICGARLGSRATSAARSPTLALFRLSWMPSTLSLVAAGGIVDGRGLAAALSLGAQAAWIGTRFLSASEADVTHSTSRDCSRADR